MIKILLTSGAFCSLLFAGIADDIAKEDILPKDIQEINKLINDLNSECKKINYYTVRYDKEEITLQQLENFYDSASATKLEVEKINKQYKERIIKFYNSYDQQSFQNIYDKLVTGTFDGHWHDYNYLRNKLSAKIGLT